MDNSINTHNPSQLLYTTTFSTHDPPVFQSVQKVRDMHLKPADLKSHAHMSFFAIFREFPAHTLANDGRRHQEAGAAHLRVAVG
jgi:hypothetical protein